MSEYPFNHESLFPALPGTPGAAAEAAALESLQTFERIVQDKKFALDPLWIRFRTNLIQREADGKYQSEIRQGAQWEREYLEDTVAYYYRHPKKYSGEEISSVLYPIMQQYQQRRESMQKCIIWYKQRPEYTDSPNPKPYDVPADIPALFLFRDAIQTGKEAAGSERSQDTVASSTDNIPTVTDKTETQDATSFSPGNQKKIKALPSEPMQAPRRITGTRPSVSKEYTGRYRPMPSGIDSLPSNSPLALLRHNGGFDTEGMAIRAGKSPDKGMYIVFNDSLKPSELWAMGAISAEYIDERRDVNMQALALQADPTEPNRSSFVDHGDVTLRRGKINPALAGGGTTGGIMAAAELITNHSLETNAMAGTIGGLLVAGVLSLRQKGYLRRLQRTRGYRETDLFDRKLAINNKLKREGVAGAVTIPDNLITATISKAELTNLGYDPSTAVPLYGISVKKNLKNSDTTTISFRPASVYVGLLLRKKGPEIAKTTWLDELSTSAVESKIIAEQHDSYTKELAAIYAMNELTGVNDPSQQVLESRLKTTSVQALAQILNTIRMFEETEYERHLQTVWNASQERPSLSNIFLNRLRTLAMDSMRTLPAGSKESYKIVEQVNMYLENCARIISGPGDAVSIYQGFGRRFGKQLGLERLADMQEIDLAPAGLKAELEAMSTEELQDIRKQLSDMNKQDD